MTIFCLIWVDGLGFVKEMSGTIEQKGFIQLQTHFFKFLDIEKVFYMDGWFIVGVYNGDFHGWDSFSNKGVCKGHSRKMKVEV